MIYLEVPGLPISVNKAYMTLRTKQRVLTKEGRAYKTRLKTELVQKYPTELKLFQKDKPYGICIQFLFKSIYNAGWPEKAETRYKRLDASNRIKLLEDVLVEATGVDDSQFLIVTAIKAQATEAGEMTRIWAWEIEEK